MVMMMNGDDDDDTVCCALPSLHYFKGEGIVGISSGGYRCCCSAGGWDVCDDEVEIGR